MRWGPTLPIKLLQSGLRAHCRSHEGAMAERSHKQRGKTDTSILRFTIPRVHRWWFFNMLPGPGIDRECQLLQAAKSQAQYILLFLFGGGTANTLASHLERSNAPGVRVMHAVYIHHPFQTAQFYTLLEGSKTIWRATAFFMIFRNLLVLLCLFSLLEESQPTPNSYPWSTVGKGGSPWLQVDRRSPQTFLQSKPRRSFTNCKLICFSTLGCFNNPLESQFSIQSPEPPTALQMNPTITMTITAEQTTNTICRAPIRGETSLSLKKKKRCPMALVEPRKQKKTRLSWKM